MGVSVFQVTVWCDVFPAREDQEYGARGVSRGGVGAIYGVLHGPAYAFAVISWVCDIGALPCVWGIVAAGGISIIFGE
jgi:hypothetical protein